MSSIQGYPSQEKLTNPLKGYDEFESKSTSQFVTVSQSFDKKVTLDAKIHGEFRTSAVPKTLTSVHLEYPKQILISTGHGAVKGDSIRFEDTAANAFFSAKVVNVPDANTLIIGSMLPTDPIIADEFYVLKTITPLYDKDGSLQVTAGPIQFIKDSVSTQVLEDTAVPTNNNPLPVKLVSVTGDINITANDLNVQLSHLGANADSTRIGDGTTLLGITVTNEAKTSDVTTHTRLTATNVELVAANASLDAIEVSTGVLELVDFATENTLLNVEALLTTIEGKDFATENTLLAIKTSSELIDDTIGTDAGAATTKGQAIGGKSGANFNLLNVSAAGAAKVDGSAVTQPVSIASMPLPTGAATEATLSALNGKDFATQTTLALINAKDFALEATQTAMSAKLPATLGQKAMAASLAVTLASNQSALNVRSGLVPLEYDEITLTYVGAGNGIGEVSTAVYKLAAATVATLTMTYDSSNRITNVVRS